MYTLKFGVAHTCEPELDMEIGEVGRDAPSEAFRACIDEALRMMLAPLRLCIVNGLKANKALISV